MKSVFCSKILERQFSSRSHLSKKFSSSKMSDTTTAEEVVSVDEKISYKQAADYWSNVDPTVDGMLGGFGKISQIDIEGSSKFLKALFKVNIFVCDYLITTLTCSIYFIIAVKPVLTTTCEERPPTYRTTILMCPPLK